MEFNTLHNCYGRHSRLQQLEERVARLEQVAGLKPLHGNEELQPQDTSS